MWRWTTARRRLGGGRNGLSSSSLGHVLVALDLPLPASRAQLPRLIQAQVGRRRRRRRIAVHMYLKLVPLVVVQSPWTQLV